MNKFLIPSILASIIVIAGVFVFVPVEKASTVHGSLDTNVDAEADAQDRAAYFSFNQSLPHAHQFGGGTLITVDGSISGTVVTSATPNECSNCGTTTIECGARDAGGSAVGTNATEGSPASATFSITDGDDILGGVDGTSSNIGGICEFMFYIDSNDG